MTEITKCYFCGGDVTIQKIPGELAYTVDCWKVYCDSCDAEGPWSNSTEEAVQKWNNDNLAACPCCGNKNMLSVDRWAESEMRITWRVVCDCGAKGPVSHISLMDAIKKWNKRREATE